MLFIVETSNGEPSKVGIPRLWPLEAGFDEIAPFYRSVSNIAIMVCKFERVYVETYFFTDVTRPFMFLSRCQ